MNIFEPSTLFQNSAPFKRSKQWVLCWIHLLLKHPSLQLVFWILHYLFSWHTKYKPVITCKVGAQNNVFCIFSAELHAEFSTHCKPAFVIQDKHKTLFFIVLTAAAAFEYKYKKRSDETDQLTIAMAKANPLKENNSPWIYMSCIQPFWAAIPFSSMRK